MIKELMNSLKPKIGDHITVVKWLSLRDRSHVGDVLRIEAIDEPFIVVKNLSYSMPRNITLDLGEVEIRPLSKEFIVAALQKEIR